MEEMAVYQGDRRIALCLLYNSDLLPFVPVRLQPHIFNDKQINGRAIITLCP